MPDNSRTEIGAQSPGGSGQLYYLACWTEDDGIYSCGHEHGSVADAMRCLVPDGRSFIRACESGAFRSLDEGEFATFLAALTEMPWRSSAWSIEKGAGTR
jgi:hypothetical protein